MDLWTEQLPKEFFEIRKKKDEIEGVVEQVIRPTGLVDPVVEVRPTKHQIDDLINEIQEKVKKKLIDANPAGV